MTSVENQFLLSVIVGTLNRPQIVLKLLRQLEKEAKNTTLEVLIFDQSDQTKYLTLAAGFPVLSNFHLIRMENPNTCRYLNLGWQQAKSDIVLYLDDDVEINGKTLIGHIDCYKNGKIKAVAGRVINDGEEITNNPQVGKIVSAGAIITKNFSYDKPASVDFPYGCNMSFRKSVLQELGGFDEKLKPPIYAYNEVDLGYRLVKKWPKSFLFSPAALVYHHRYPSGGTRSFSQTEVDKSVNFNYGYFLGRNFNWLQNFTCLLRRLPYQLAREPHRIPDIIKGFIYGKEITPTT